MPSRTHVDQYHYLIPPTFFYKCVEFTFRRAFNRTSLDEDDLIEAQEVMQDRADPPSIFVERFNEPDNRLDFDPANAPLMRMREQILVCCRLRRRAERLPLTNSQAGVAGQQSALNRSFADMTGSENATDLHSLQIFLLLHDHPHQVVPVMEGLARFLFAEIHREGDPLAEILVDDLANEWYGAMGFVNWALVQPDSVNAIGWRLWRTRLRVPDGGRQAIHM